MSHYLKFITTAILTQAARVSRMCSAFLNFDCRNYPTMSSVPSSTPDPSMPAHLRPEVVQAIEEAHELARSGDNGGGIERLEQALANVSKASDLDEFKERVSLAMALAEFSVNAGEPQKAIQRLANEFATAKETFQRI